MRKSNFLAVGVLLTHNSHVFALSSTGGGANPRNPG